MTMVGIRELKAHLSRYLKRVKKGESLAVTDHGCTVAILAPNPKSDHARKMWELVRKGIIDWGGGTIDWTHRRLVKIKGKPMSDTVIEMRREARY